MNSAKQPLQLQAIDASDKIIIAFIDGTEIKSYDYKNGNIESYAWARAYAAGFIEGWLVRENKENKND